MVRSKFHTKLAFAMDGVFFNHLSRLTGNFTSFPGGDMVDGLPPACSHAVAVEAPRQPSFRYFSSDPKEGRYFSQTPGLLIFTNLFIFQPGPHSFPRDPWRAGWPQIKQKTQIKHRCFIYEEKRHPSCWARSSGPSPEPICWARTPPPEPRTESPPPPMREVFEIGSRLEP